MATTYFVATTGNDSNSGTSIGSPFRNPQKCCNVMVAGDTCTVADGTYTHPAENTRDYVVDLGSGAKPGIANGTAIAPITLKSTNKYGAILQIPTTPAVNNEGIHANRSFWIIDGFEIVGPGGDPGSGPPQASNTGIVATAPTGLIIRNNKIHTVSTGFCTSNSGGSAGIYTQGVSSILIENNIIYTIGRLLQGESGCGIDNHNHDHGIYIGSYDGGSGFTVRNNLFYDITRGWPLQMYGGNPSTGTLSNLNIYNNTFADSNPTFNPGSIGIFGAISSGNIKNNLCYNPKTSCITSGDITYGTISGVQADWNMSTTAIGSGTVPGITYGGNNKANQTASSLFTNPATRDYTLKAGSPAIDNGTNVGITSDLLGAFRPQGSGFDVGAYEFGAFVPDTTPPAVPTGLRVI